MQDDETLGFYARNARSYAARERRLPEQRLTTFLAALPPGAPILELGTGGGQDAQAMIAAGFAVTPTDGSPELAAEASARLGQPVKIMRFEALEDVAAYAGVWASASLLHAPREALTGILTRIHRALRPGGVFVASYKRGKAEGRDAFGRYYNYFDADTLRQHYESAAGWREVVIEEQAGSGYDNLPTDWLWVTARKG